MSSRLLRIALAGSVVVLCGAKTKDQGAPALLFERPYPLEYSINYPAGLLHWLDSVGGLEGSGMTGGKTRRAHQDAFEAVQGKPTGADEEMLKRFARVRSRVAERRPEASAALTGACFESRTVEDALRVAGRDLEPSELEDLTAVFTHFGPAYTKIWKEGEVPRGFVERVRADPRRKELGELLARVARFYAVDAKAKPRPLAVLVPVRASQGTHAQAIGRYLLIEIRELDGLSEQAAPLVHELSHFLWNRDTVREPLLRDAAYAAGPFAVESWSVLHEALPTAVGQGIAGNKFQGSWSEQQPWYHYPIVDTYAKKLYPVVREAFESGATIDAALVRKMIDLNAPAPAASP